MPFWKQSFLDLDDELNAEIWVQSPAEQDRIQPYREHWDLDAIGAQQAMRSPSRLPWVPDLVGTQWRSSDAIVVVGSAYGPFISGDRRQHELSPADYLQDTAGAFQKHFLGQVVGTREYYRRIATLASHVVADAQHLVLTDLCRVAFVRRGQTADGGGDGVANCAKSLFHEYVEGPCARDWSWRRLIASQATVVVALGTIAEHGLLRLFHHQLSEPRIVDSVDPSLTWKPRRSRTPHAWPGQYASDRRKLKHRKAAPIPPWWEISGRLPSGGLRRWRLVVVPHPTGAYGDPGDYPERVLRAAYTNRPLSAELP